MRQALLRSIRRCASVSTSSPGADPPLAISSKLLRSYAVAAPVAEEEGEHIVFPREGPGVTYGLNWALAGRGVLVKDKAFYNPISSGLKRGAAAAGSSRSIPLYIKGDVTGGSSEISKVQFAKLMKQVTTHLSSVSNVYVQDGSIGSSPKFDAKVRIISDNDSAVEPISNLLWRIPSRAISHDTCPLTVYVARSISQCFKDILGHESQSSDGFAAVDVERSSLILCGNAFADSNAIKGALSALAAPIISARGGLPLSARLLVSGDSIVLLFAPQDAIKGSSDIDGALVHHDAGVILSAQGVAPFFHTGDPKTPNLLRRPASVVVAASDSTGVLPLISKLSPGQTAYHFLAGYQDGKFVFAYNEGPSSIGQLELANALTSELKDNEIPSYLINVNDSGKLIPGKELVNLVSSTLSGGVPDVSAKSGSAPDSKVTDLKGKYKRFLSSKFKELPEEFSF